MSCAISRQEKLGQTPDSPPSPQRVYGRTLTSQPAFFGWIVYQIFLAMELRYKLARNINKSQKVYYNLRWNYFKLRQFYFVLLQEMNIVMYGITNFNSIKKKRLVKIRVKDSKIF